VVVGEQVTLSVYLYFGKNSIADRGGDTKRMPLQDFLQYPIMPDGSQAIVRARAGGIPFSVRLLEKVAVFPMKTGALRTGAHSETFTAPNRRTTFKRASENLAIVVSEPPAANRPVGYRLGGRRPVPDLRARPAPQDHGRWQCGGAGEGHRELRQLPHLPQPPEKTGVEWLDPEKKEQMEPKNGEISGFRSFGHVVKPHPDWHRRSRHHRAPVLEPSREALRGGPHLPRHRRGDSLEDAPPAPSASSSASASRERTDRSPFRELLPAARQRSHRILFPVADGDPPRRRASRSRSSPLAAPASRSRASPPIELLEARARPPRR
jgi:hypothetical protein